jgi:N-acetylglucosaminyldiphosphoundecaprenol N-acetyl-beta-D-mannosaminyltransferase
MNMMESVGVRVDNVDSLNVVLASIAAALDTKRTWLMTFANPATAIAARQQPELRAALQAFDMVAPDGIGMVQAMKWLHHQRPARISFDTTSLAPPVFAMAVARGLPIALVGGAPGIAAIAAEKIRQAHPGINIVLTADGYRAPAGLIEELIKLQPKIVVAGMGVMVQERFLLALAQRGWVGLGFTCGGYLDQLAVKGTTYYPAWVDRHNLRWAYRLMSEPGRLWRRYLLDYPKFGLLLGQDLLQNRLKRAHDRLA